MNNNTITCPENIDETEFNFKYKKAKEHFISRLRERYDYRITEDYYDEIIFSIREKIYNKSCKFQGKFKKSGTATLGLLEIEDKEIWCIYNSRLGLLTTAMPPNIENNIYEMIQSCFSRPIRPIAYKIYEEIDKELKLERTDFSTIKDAAMYYYEKSIFTSILIAKYKNNISPLRICHTIRSIIDDKHHSISLKLSFDKKLIRY